MGAAVSEEEAGVRDTTHTSEEAETDLFRKGTILPESSNNTICIHVSSFDYVMLDMQIF